MSNICAKCGAILTEGQAFCISCGTRLETLAVAQAASYFCTTCGSQVQNGSVFCTKCGARADGRVSAASAAGGVAKAAAAQSSDSPDRSGTPQLHATSVVLDDVDNTDGESSQSALIPSPRAKTSREVFVPPQKKSSHAKILIAVLGLLGLLLTGITGSCIYVGYRVKKKAEQIHAAYKSGDANKLAGALGPNGSAAGRTQKSNASPSPAESSPTGPAEVIPDYVFSGVGFVPPEETVPAEPEAATGDRIHDWALKYERTTGGPEADLVVRTGDINNLGFGWPKDFDPFSGNSTPMHPWPTKTPVDEPQGTDRIMIGSAVSPIYISLERVEDQQKEVEYAYKGHPQAVYRQLNPPANNWSSPPEGDGYTDTMFAECTQPQRRHAPLIPAWVLKECAPERHVTMPMPILLPVGTFRFEIHSVLFQIFLDDFQAPRVHSHFQVSLNGTRIPSFEEAINSLDQSGPVGKLVSLNLLPEYWPLLQSGTVKLLIDDPTTHARDGYAIDFVRVLVNPYKLKYQVTLQASVFDADKHTAITGATVAAGLTSATTDKGGQCTLRELPAGLVTAVASAPGYDTQSIPVDIASGETGTAQFQLHRHQESTADLEKSIAETGSATLYGIHFDTDSAKLRADSGPSLAAILALMKNHPDSHWIIAGHTDNQGDSVHNQKLSEERSASVSAWLKSHDIAEARLLSQGFGSSRPVADNATANGRALNRRVELSRQ
jgi:outer membrane protein OmpA-like peptidoglycan-associated protein